MKQVYGRDFVSGTEGPRFLTFNAIPIEILSNYAIRFVTRSVELENAINHHVELNH